MSLEPISGVPSHNLASNLGNLAQVARKKQLNVARNILIIVGILTLIGNGLCFANAKKETEQVVQKEIRDVQARGQQPDPVSVVNERTHILRFCKIIYGSAIGLGVVFVVLGFSVRSFPVPSTVLGLVLYISGVAIFGYLSSATLIQGIVFKVIIVVALIRSIQAAIAYQKGMDATSFEPSSEIPA